MLWSILYTSIRASPPTLHMWTSKNISHIQALLMSNFFSNPTHKTETGTASKYVGETTNSNPVGQIKLSTQLETRSSEQIVRWWVCLLHCSMAPPGLWKLWTLLGFPVVDSLDLSDEPLIQDLQCRVTYWHWWRCSNLGTCWVWYQVYCILGLLLILIIMWVCIIYYWVSWCFFPFKKIPKQSLIDWQEVQIQLACLHCSKSCQGGQILIPIWILELCLSVKQNPLWNEAHCHCQFQSGGKEQ